MLIALETWLMWFYNPFMTMLVSSSDRWSLVENLKLNFSWHFDQEFWCKNLSYDQIAQLHWWKQSILGLVVPLAMNNYKFCCSSLLQPRFASYQPNFVQKKTLLKKKLCLVNLFADFLIILTICCYWAFLAFLQRTFQCIYGCSLLFIFLAAPAAVILIWEYLHKSN